MRVKEENDFMRDAILLDGVAKQIVSGVGAIMNDKNKPIDLKKLYPELFKPKQTPYASDVEVWDKFLRG